MVVGLRGNSLARARCAALRILSISGKCACTAGRAVDASLITAHGGRSGCSLAAWFEKRPIMRQVSWYISDIGM